MNTHSNFIFGAFMGSLATLTLIFAVNHANQRSNRHAHERIEGDHSDRYRAVLGEAKDLLRYPDVALVGMLSSVAAIGEHLGGVIEDPQTVDIQAGTDYACILYFDGSKDCFDLMDITER
jgi:hypothetical protein